jgi:hypothetical protein
MSIRTKKWVALMACGAICLQASACVGTIAQILVQNVATTVLSSFLTGVIDQINGDNTNDNANDNA